ncbi:MAG: UDP-glucose/GDP-mannose dehydrogenase family protein, partial [Bdellovibrionales bacterium]|nr:UDP-glucose/GDP-mannose dehydrogenase family protein [Bdellovibrionales bacterium]
VVCVYKAEYKINKLRQGDIPIYEPGLSDLVRRNTRNSRLTFTTSLKEAVESSEVIFIAVGTPQDEDGSADLQHVLAVAEGIGEYMNGPKIIVDKSTVPVGTAKLVHDTIAKLTKHEFDVVSNPEFLKEGAALDDFMKPDRVVIGAPSERSAQVMKELYSPFVRTNNPILLMDVPSAELTKYAANAMLATRVSFMNEIANLCEKVGADIDHVRVGMGTDSRIGMSFLFPGIGYGGSCFPKDVQALLKTARDYGVELKIGQAVEDVNFAQKKVLVDKVKKHYGGKDLQGKTFAVWGLAFKPRTDDVREAPALVVCSELIKLGAKVVASDPEGIENFRGAFGENPALSYAYTNYDCLNNADGLVICTEWNEYRNPSFERMKKLMKEPVVFDGRNILSRKEVARHSFVYYSIGRPDVSVKG